LHFLSNSIFLSNHCEMTFSLWYSLFICIRAPWVQEIFPENNSYLFIIYKGCLNYPFWFIQLVMRLTHPRDIVLWSNQYAFHHRTRLSEHRNLPETTQNLGYQPMSSNDTDVRWYPVKAHSCIYQLLLNIMSMNLPVDNGFSML
jgi:hypothetical protein